MKEDTLLKEQKSLLEKEIVSLTEQLDRLSKDVKDLQDIRDELKGLKLFIGRVHPEFKNEFPEILQKVYRKS